jgi:hypothetical protein
MAGGDQSASLRDASWERFVDAVIAYRARRVDAVVAYLKDVESRLGREVALSLKSSVRMCALAKSWQNVAEWPAHGYMPPPPTSPGSRGSQGRRGTGR